MSQHDNNAVPAASQRIFWPRVSEVIGDVVEAVQLPPEQPLGEAGKRDVLAFEKELFSGHFEDITCTPGLDKVPSVIDTSYTFAPSYLLTPQGKKALADFAPDSTEPASESDGVHALRSLPFAYLADKKKELEAFSGDSMRYAKSQYQEAAQDDTEIEDILTVSIKREPEKFIGKLTALIANRSFIHEVRKRLAESDADGTSPVTQAKLVVTQIYRDRINSDLAGMYPSLQELLQQEAAQSEPDRQELASQLELARAMVNVARAALAGSDIQATFIRRLDYVRNGAAYNDGRMTPIDARIFDDVEALNRTGRETVESVFKEDEIERLENFSLDADGLKRLIEKYMEEIGITEWEPEIRADTNSIKISGINKKIKIPRDYSQKLAQTSPSSGAVAIVEHEIGGDQPGHVMQYVNAAQNDQALRIGTHPKYKGKRATALREAGGVTAEADAMHRYFGQERKAQSAYAKAMEVLVENGTVSRAVAAFAIDYLKDSPETDTDDRAKIYKLAADRVLRLKRFGGHNSQPLNYVEAATVRRTLESTDLDTQKTILAEGIFDPVDMLRLHRYGLLTTDTSHLFSPRENPTAVMARLIRDMINTPSSDNAEN